MTVTTISLKEETTRILNEIRKSDPDFNLSGFLAQALDSYFEKKDVTYSKNSIDKEIEFMYSQITSILQKIELFRNRKIEIEINEETEKQREIIKGKKQIEDLKYKQRIIKKTFNQEMNRDMTDEEFNEYNGKLEGNIVENIWEFIGLIKKRPKFEEVEGEVKYEKV